MNDQSVQRLIRNQAFWDHTLQDRPLLGVAVNITFPELSFTHRMETEEVTPDMIRPEAYFEDWDHTFTTCEARQEDVFLSPRPWPVCPGWKLSPTAASA